MAAASERQPNGSKEAMMGERPTWSSGPTLAWTEHDGPGRPPGGGDKRLAGALAWALAGVVVGMFSTDVLCPEHRAWVLGFAGLATVAIGVALVGLFRRWTSAPLVALIAAGGGVAIGLLDMAHVPLRGGVVALAYGLVALGASVLAVRTARLARWGRRAVADATRDASDLLVVCPHGEEAAVAPTHGEEVELGSVRSRA